jgi:hypothetical protein
MATAEDLLQKAEARKKKNGKKFIPDKRRAWDYYTSETPKTPQDKWEQNSNENRIENSNKSEQIWEQNRIENSNKSEQIWEQNGNKNRIENSNNNGNCSQENTNDSQGRIKQEGVALTSITKQCIEDQVIKILRKTEGYQKYIMVQITAHIKSMPEATYVIDIPIDILSKRISADKNTTRTSIKRLQKKSILMKVTGTRGRHGCTRILVPNFIAKECFNLFNCMPCSLDDNRNVNGDINRNINGNTEPISSSSYILTTTTNSDGSSQVELPENWKLLDIDPLVGIGFSETQIKQLIDKNIFEVVQESIYHFAYGLEHNPKTQEYKKNGKNPLNVLMGVLRKGQGWFENSYRSPHEIAQEKFLKHKMAEQERLKNLEAEAYKLALLQWKETLSAEEFEKIAPSKKSNEDIIPQDVKLSLYFKEKMWPEKRKEFIINKN